MSRTTITLVIILVLTLGARAGAFIYVYWQDSTRMLAPDSISYENPALALLTTGRYAKSVDQPGEPEVRRTPGYPALIALVYAVFGQSRPTLMAVQILMSVATLAGLFVLARRWFGPRVALIATSLLALDPASFLSSQMMLSETPFVLVFLLAVYAMTRALGPEGIQARWALLAATALALATLIRPISYFLIYPVLIGAAVVDWRRGAGWRRIALHGAAILIPWAALIWGWQARNWAVAGRAEFSYLKNDVLLMYAGGRIVQMRDGITIEEARARIREQLPDTTGWAAADISRLHHERAMELIRQNPGLFLKAHVTGAAQILLSPAGRSIREYLGMDAAFSPVRELRAAPGRFPGRALAHPGATLLMLYELMFTVMVWLGIAAGAWAIVRRRREREAWALHGLLAGIVLFMLIMSAGSQTSHRFRVPISPLLFLYAALGLSVLWEMITRKKNAEIISSPAPAGVPSNPAPR